MSLSDKYADIKKTVKKELSKERYQHTLGVAYTASCLAMRYGEDMERAYLAGLLHDNAKQIPDDEKIRTAEKLEIPISDAERENPSLLHAKLGAYYAESRFDITDPGILSAILFHTTGRPDMDLLEKIIFVADYIEPNRDRAKNLSELRSLAFKDLDRAVLRIAEDTMTFISMKDGVSMDPKTAEVVEYYKKLLNKNDQKDKKKA